MNGVLGMATVLLHELGNLCFSDVITLAVLKTLDMEANQTGARQPMSSQFVLACCSRGKFTSSAEQNALSYVNCIIWDLSVCL
jgi:hypothetical protein